MINKMGACFSDEEKNYQEIHENQETANWCCEIDPSLTLLCACCEH